VANSVVSHAKSNRKATFGELAEAASKQPVPEKVVLKDAKDFKLIGKTAPRKDSVAKTNGTAVFTQDMKLPGMLVAVVAHPPRFGGTVKKWMTRRHAQSRACPTWSPFPVAWPCWPTTTGLQKRPGCIEH